MDTVNQNNQHRHDGQRDFQQSNQRNNDNIRSNTEKHQYSDYEELTNDQNFSGGSPTSMGDDMDFRDKDDNLADQDDE